MLSDQRQRTTTDRTLNGHKRRDEGGRRLLPQGACRARYRECDPFHTYKFLMVPRTFLILSSKVPVGLLVSKTLGTYGLLETCLKDKPKGVRVQIGDCRMERTSTKGIDTYVGNLLVLH